MRAVGTYPRQPLQPGHDCWARACCVRSGPERLLAGKRSARAPRDETRDAVQIRASQREAVRLLGHAAAYIAVSAALHPYKPTYKQALGIVRHMLPKQVCPPPHGPRFIAPMPFDMPVLTRKQAGARQRVPQAAQAGTHPPC